MDNQHYENAEKTFSIGRCTSIHSDLDSFPMHNHNHSEIYVLLSERAGFRVEGRYYDVRQGDILIFSSREFHNVSFALDKPYSRITLNLKREYFHNFVQSDYDLFAGFNRRRLGEGNLIRRETAQESGISTCVDDAVRFAFGDLPEKDLLLQSVLLRMLVSINHVVDSAGQATQPAVHNQKVMDIINYINSNLAEDLSLAALEKRFFMSRYHLSHIFKQATGFPISQYITSKRVKYADELITGGTSTLDACMLAGFNDYSNFYKTFKKMTGHSPKQSRK